MIAPAPAFSANEPPEDEAPFGAFAPTALQSVVRRLGANLPPGYLGRKGASILLGMAGGRRKRPIDCVVFETQRARLRPYDNICEKRVYISPQLWDAKERAALARRISSTGPAEPFYFADIGANVGLYTLFARSIGAATGRSVKCLCVEPDPEMLRRLKFNLRQSNAATDVVVAPFAATDVARSLRFHIDAKSRGSSRIEATGKALVEGKPLLTLIREAGFPRLDAMKIDIEGHEIAALQPFLREAARELVPALIILETKKNERSSPATDLLIAHGYEPEFQTRMNTVLRLKN